MKIASNWLVNWIIIVVGVVNEFSEVVNVRVSYHSLVAPRLRARLVSTNARPPLLRSPHFSFTSRCVIFIKSTQRVGEIGRRLSKITKYLTNNFHTFLVQCSYSTYFVFGIVKVSQHYCHLSVFCRLVNCHKFWMAATYRRLTLDYLEFGFLCCVKKGK